MRPTPHHHNAYCRLYIYIVYILYRYAKSMRPTPHRHSTYNIHYLLTLVNSNTLEPSHALCVCVCVCV